MLKKHKEIVSKLNDLGVVVDVEVTSNHTKLRLNYKGMNWTYFCASTPSDPRAVKNLVADVRRWTRRVDDGAGLPKGA